MAFDSTTRNVLARMVGSARALLSKEFTEQLQEIYGIQPDGTVIEIKRLTHLDDEDRAIASMLRDRVNHLISNIQTEKEQAVSAIDRMIREQAFTLLNRFAALRMCEERSIVRESVANGIQSKGFQVYLQIAGSGLGNIYGRYKTYLLCLFDEIAVDLGVIFDRFSSFGLLFPREDALLELLNIINEKELKHLWAEDETIGWIYQYFNSQEERKKMRDESTVPRNSRELAVRNQFFTPRYVVEFLTDNTLGRIWYEMTQGETSLREQCLYLVRRPNEIFLVQGEDTPEENYISEDLNQEELLKQPAYIPFRKLKDPREIKMLDPACGSMHFGLYAFDLYETIYNEAWDIESQYGALHFQRSKQFKPLHEQYESKEVFIADIPRLIIEHNIHGIDIDPRAVQISGLSLWLRGQKSWLKNGIKLSQRPKITKSNIVCAEPMPGDKGLLEEFTEDIKPIVLGQLIQIIFNKMKLADEAGSLLKIEEEIEGAVEEARTAFNEELRRREEESGYLPGMAPKKDQMSLFDFADLPDRTQFWINAEERIFESLLKYSEHAHVMDANRKSLFAKDAAKGFAFIDVCRKKYDLVLMNPPFGEFSKTYKKYSRLTYPHSYNDILGAFVERWLNKLEQKGRLGAITSRTCFFLTSFSDWREKVILAKSSVTLVADLGQGVMDDAMVEAASYILERSKRKGSIPFIRAIAEPNREEIVSKTISQFNFGVSGQYLFLALQKTFLKLPDAPFVYWAREKDLDLFSKLPYFEPRVGDVRQGLATGDDPRFVRTTWEVAPQDTQFVYYPTNGDAFCRLDDPIVLSYYKRCKSGSNRWAFHVKSGTSQPWYSPITLKIDWHKNGFQLRNFRNEKGKLRSRPQNIAYFYRPGFSWTRRSRRFYPYVIPVNCIPSVSRYMAFPDYGEEYIALAVSASRIASAFMRFYGEKFEWPNFLVENLKILPWPEIPEDAKRFFYQFINHEIDMRRQAYMNHEPFQEFLIPGKIKDFSNGGQSLAFNPETLLGEEGEQLVAKAYGLDKKAALRVERDVIEAIKYQHGNLASSENLENENDEDDSKENSDFVLDYSEKAQLEAMLSYCVGCVFAHWDIRFALNPALAPKLPAPFDPLPVCPPGTLVGSDGLPAKPGGIVTEEWLSLRPNAITLPNLKAVKNSTILDTEYPIKISWHGILVLDQTLDTNHGLCQNIVDCIREVLGLIFKNEVSDIEQESCNVLNVSDLGEYFQKPSGFFSDHLKRYSKSRRKAPVYWPLSSNSGKYTLWIFYHRLNDQTLFNCLTEYVNPKVEDAEKDAKNFRNEIGDNGSAIQLKKLEALVDLKNELIEFQDEILRISSLPYKPSLNDGVMISAAPLWKLFRHNQWSKELKKCWKGLEKGDYDWAHIALNIWPERVISKCQIDLSLAIAHEIENELWDKIEDGTDRTGNQKFKWVPKKLSKEELQKIINERTGK